MIWRVLVEQERDERERMTSRRLGLSGALLVAFHSCAPTDMARLVLAASHST